MEHVEFEDFTALEGEGFLLDDPELEMDFLTQLKQTEVVPGIVKYSLKVPKNVPLVAADSHIAAQVVHRTIQGEFTRANNNNWHMGRKLKLGGLNDRELVLCVKTMCPEEISYFKIDRHILDQNEEGQEMLTDVERKRLESGKLKDGYYRIEIKEETKVKTNPVGPLNLESQLKAIQDNKTVGNCDIFVV